MRMKDMRRGVTRRIRAETGTQRFQLARQMSAVAGHHADYDGRQSSMHATQRAQTKC